MNPDPTTPPEPISTSDIEEKPEQHWFKTQWADNHGNFLIAFVIGTVLVNAAYVAYQQAKFVPPKFPDASAFDDPIEESNVKLLPVDESVNFRVIGAQTMTGNIVIALYESKEDMSKRELALRNWTVPIEDGIALWSVAPEELPESFAAAAFHDENADGEITKNSYGVPIERYGYTGNQRFLEPEVPPSFEQILIVRPETGEHVEIFIR